MTVNPETLYLQLQRLVATMPDLAKGPLTPEVHQWLGRAAVLVEAAGDGVDAISLKVSVDSLDGPIRQMNAGTIVSVVHRALARAEALAPVTAQGAFIAAGDTLGAFAAAAKVLAQAKKDILMVDRYADQTIITDFAVTAPDSVPVRILAGDKEGRKATMRPAVERWGQKFGATKPIEVRVIQETKLHDRLIVIDGAEAWSPHQSFNGMAKSSPTSIERSDPELGAAKIAAYEELWQAGDPL
ncbi:hypothetical protein [Bradyrhizobium sp. AUGA SZCCT0160]|uniref:hypothetical protein n=1 Tax=Bradyrhizobium sp. AUGA SZCCT0160 TaxID=2807662 RepID=UPI001BADDCD4|nr:hypothetical protein [Bradyrhizobium sp. AUGA SZCCT0160]MBR1193964.1 hypothetical protein [Bradyrhizobium sp. AUGA SZCCT0160]